MQSILGRITHNVSQVAHLVSGIAKRIDYERLSRYILEINRQNGLEDILAAVSRCLKDILDYRLFAFAIQEGERFKVWVDPKIHEAALRNLIEKDFNLPDGMDICKFNDCSEEVAEPVAFHGDNVMSYMMSGPGYYARLYIVPERRILRHHEDIMEIIVKTLGIAVSHYARLEHLRNEAAFDALTDCYNRREFDRLIGHNVANADRYDKGLSVVMVDIDRFKSVNDTYGHQAGDRVLKEVSRTLRSSIRKSDYVARYGGEEFVVVLPDTRMTKAIELAERLREVVENLVIDLGEGRTLRVTASFGVASWKKDSDERTLLGEADAMLYRAKENGRNMVMPGLRGLHAPSANADRKASARRAPWIE